MKRLFAFLLATALLLGIAGCKSSTPQLPDPDFEQLPMIPGKAHTDYSGIENSSDSKQTAPEVQYCAQYIRTDGYQEGAQFPRVQIINSLQELKDYYTAHKEIFNLERREIVYADTSIGFLDACDQYDESFFIENFLLFVLLEEGSGSVRHEIRTITQTPDQKLAVSVDRKVPEAGDCDMAQWHIILEFNRENMVEAPDDVQVSLNSCNQETEGHTHSIATDAQTVEDPFVGYCGNTWTVLHIGDQEYSFMYSHSITLTDILINLDYDPDKLCNCRPEYTVDTEFALGYGINLTQGYARCDKGQADLTQEQIDQIAKVIEWAETTNGEYSLSI